MFTWVNPRLGQSTIGLAGTVLYLPDSRMEKVSAGCPPGSSGEGPAAWKGTESSVTSAPTSKEAKIKLLVFVRPRRLIDWLNSLIMVSAAGTNIQWNLFGNRMRFIVTP
jgi:hypothetical protein